MNKVLSIAFPQAPRSRSERQEARANQAQALVMEDSADLDEPYPSAWNPDQFGRRQLSGLVQRLFFPGWPHPCRQVVVTSVDQSPTGEVCARIANAMSQELPGTVCAIEAAAETPSLEDYVLSHNSLEHQEKAPGLHPNCTQVNGNFWLLTLKAFLREGYDQAKVAWLRSRLSEFRREFDYTILHVPAVADSGDAILFGQLCDGVILVLKAHSTRRAAALSARDTLRQANVRLLGSVLDQRTFPVPQLVYSKL